MLQDSQIPILDIEVLNIGFSDKALEILRINANILEILKIILHML